MFWSTGSIHYLRMFILMLIKLTDFAIGTFSRLL